MTKLSADELKEIRELSDAVMAIGSREWTARERHLDRKWAPIAVNRALLEHIDVLESERKAAYRRGQEEMRERARSVALRSHPQSTPTTVAYAVAALPISEGSEQ